MSSIINPSCSDRRLQRALQYFAKDLSKQPTLAELASVAGMGRTYFSRHFLEAVGVNFSTWSRYVRIERAKELLARSDLPITTVASTVGYADITTFERNFRKNADCSPRQYRRNQRRTQLAQNIATFADNSSIKAETTRDTKV